MPDTAAVAELEQVASWRRWSMLGIALIAPMFTSTLVMGSAFLVPTLHSDEGLSLAQAALIASMPYFGLTLTLVPWGVAVDRFGERWSLAAGTTLVAAAAFAVALVDSTTVIAVLLFAGGMAAGSTNSASGRLVVGWFPPHQRGLVMGIRQTAQPFGVGLASLIMTPLAASHGIAAALLLPAIGCAGAAVLSVIGVRDPARPSRSEADPELVANPYRGASTLVQIHAMSVLLVVPQVVVWSFAVVWLVEAHDMSPGGAGLLVALTQVAGALARIAVGKWSDWVGSRLEPVRWLALTSVVVMLVLALTDALGSQVSIYAMVAALVIAVSHHALPFTSVAEIAGPFWSGRALGIHSTSGFLMAGVAPPVVGALIGVTGYAPAFAVAAVFPLVALMLVPRSPRAGREGSWGIRSWIPIRQTPRA